jgi:hypothetical protein
MADTNAHPENDKTKATDAHRDQDVKKGAVEENRPGPVRSSAPALDANGLPNDATAIAQDALGAAVDQSQG